MAEIRSVALSKGERLPFFRSICPCFQVLNFDNNILQFISTMEHHACHG
nr:MAG TPA: hypothetical protein [Caudoviricetes sp.]